MAADAAALVELLAAASVSRHGRAEKRLRGGEGRAGKKQDSLHKTPVKRALLGAERQSTHRQRSAEGVVEDGLVHHLVGSEARGDWALPR